MKNLKKVIFSAALVVACMASVNAQTSTESAPMQKSMRQGGGGGMMDALNLTDAQKAQMKANREASKAANEKFRASFTEDQKAMVNEMGRPTKENREKFEASLSAEQKATLQANKDAEKKNQEAFAATLNAEQKAKYDEMQKNRGGGDRQGGGQGGQRKPKPAGE